MWAAARSSLLALLLGVAFATAQSGTPSWAVEGQLNDGAPQERAAAIKAVQKLNSDSRRADVLLWGDSFTAGLARNGGAQTWKKHFKALDALPLGMRGSTVEQLAWRIMKGGELPKRAPKAVLLFIGVNNLIQGKGSPAERLEWLLQWAKARWPGTRFGVVALTPHNWDNSRLVGPTNKQYRAMATRQGAAWIECCQDWSPSNAGLYGDGLHFTPKGNDRLVQCLRAGAGKLLSP